MRDLVFIPVELIKRAEQFSWLRSLGYFVRMKRLYKNNTHYNYSLRSLAEKLKCSPACLSVHIKVLTHQGLIEFHAGNVTFLGLKRLQAKFKSNNVGVPAVNHKNQLDFLRAQIIRFNLSAQSYNIKKSGIQLRKAKKAVPFTRTEKTNSCYPGLSAQGVGYLFGLSTASGSRVRKKLEIFGLLSSKRVYSILLRGINTVDYINMKRGGQIPIYSFLKEGRVLVERRPHMEYIKGT